MRKLNVKHSLLLGTSIAAFAWAVSPALAQNAENETVIVTGTRVQGMTAADSAAPITVLGTDALTHGTGSADLRDALGQTVPSFTAQQFGGDTANLTLSAALRGLSPNDTLVLVNGKRRHYTSNLHVGAGDFAGGSSSADLSMIPQAAIDHVEVLLDGAAAQYGTDAVVGVVNMILKKKSSGGQLSATFGNYYDRGHRSPADNGEKYSVSGNIGMPLFDKGFVNVTVEKQYGNYTQYGGADARYFTAQGTVVPQAIVNSVGTNGVAVLRTPTTTPPGQVGNQIPDNMLAGVVGYPRANNINGKPEYQLTMGVVNAGYDFSDNFSVYANGTIGHKFAKSNENDRLPNQIIATIGSNQPCSATNPNGYATGSSTQVGATGVGTAPSCTGPFTLAGSVAGPGAPGAGVNSRGQIISSGNAGNLFSATLINATTGAQIPSATGGTGILGTTPELVFAPNGFRPQEVLKEDDYQYNAGMRFNVMGWDIDANVGYGKDIAKIYTWNSGNRSLFIDTHTSPTNFYDGAFTASQLTGTLDATHAFNVGMASPLTVALGVEAREDLYGISAGEPLSYYKEGAQSFPGFTPTAAGAHSRKNYAAYIDFAIAPIEQIQIDIAGRAEHYTDFGDTQIGKLTARYDITPEFAIRGTVSTGFRAPTLAEEFYTAVNVSPVAATVQLPADSAAAQLLGLGGLTPEISTSSSVGFVAHPFADLTVTMDAYNIAIGHRVTTSATVTSSGGAINTPLVTQAVTAVGVQLDPTATQQGVTAFLNGIATITQGVDLTVNYPTDFGDMGLIDWTLAGNFNETRISSVLPPPAVLTASNPSASFFRPDFLQNFVNSAPKEKIGLTANWSLDQFGITFRETYWGPRHATTTPNNGGTVITQNQAGVLLTDLEGRYEIVEGLEFSLGANNLFNMRPGIQGFATGPGFTNGNNSTTGVSVPAGNGSVQNNYLATAWDPNGGYYYGRVTFNF